MNLVFLGASGSGKDTQAELLVQKYNYERISTGDLLRMLCEGENKIQQMVKLAMNAGFLNDKFVYGLLEMYFMYYGSENFILSGVVRTLNQVELLDSALKISNKKVDKAVYFELSDAEAIHRISGRLYCPNCKSNFHKEFNPPKVENVCDNCEMKLLIREDDNPESIANRLRDFHKDNDKIIESYRERGILLVMDASKSIEEIHKDLLKALGYNDNGNI